MAHQSSFLGFKKQKKVFGGRLLGRTANCHAREARPVSTKDAMHVVMRATAATGLWSFLTKENARAIDHIVRRQAKIHGLRLYRYENVGNHLHILVRAGSRRGFMHFLRSVPALVSRAVVGGQKGRPTLRRLWEQRPFTRVVKFGRDYRGTFSYLEKNRLQALGFVDRVNRDAELLLSG